MSFLRSLSENDGYRTDVELNNVERFYIQFFYLLPINATSRLIIFLVQVLLIKKKRELDI